MPEYTDADGNPIVYRPESIWREPYDDGSMQSPPMYMGYSYRGPRVIHRGITTVGGIALMLLGEIIGASGMWLFLHFT